MEADGQEEEEGFHSGMGREVVEEGVEEEVEDEVEDEVEGVEEEEKERGEGARRDETTKTGRWLI